MNKPTNKYWQKRFELLTESLLNKGERYTKDLATEYEKSIVSIQSDIQKFYSRFAQNNSMTLAESKKLLNSKELQEFHWTVEEYIQKGKENAINQLWMKELENASTRVRVKRLEALQYQIRQQIEMITARRLDGMNRLSDELIKDGYYKSIYEIQKGFGIGNTFSILDTKIIENIISKPWAPDGSNFSSRIWRDRDVLVSKLQTELAQTFIRGDAPDTAIRNISKTMDVSRRSAGRLVMTESAYFSAEGQKKAYQELEIEEYEIVATLDTITSDLCQSLDGNVLPMSEYSPGTTAPPFHPYCRTVTVPYFSDNDTERFARGIDGKGYKVPGDMTYKDWFNSLTENEQGKMVLNSIKAKNYNNDKQQHSKYKLIFGDEIPSNLEDFQELKYNNIKEWENIKSKKQDILNSLDYRDSFFGKFGDREVREWYIAHDKGIPNLIDNSKTTELQARQSHSLRNKYRTEARLMMRNRETAEGLNKDYPNQTFENLLEHKKNKYKLTDDEAYTDIIRSSQTTNKAVNKSLGLE